MSASGVITININLKTQPASRKSFGIPCVFTYHTKDPARALVFTSADDMLVAGGGPFAVTDAAYVLTNAAFAQTPRPPQVIVARRINPTLRTVVVEVRSGTINGETFPRNDTDYPITIDGETFTFTSDSTATDAEIALGLVALINGGAVNVLATDNIDGTFDIEKADTPGGAATAGVWFTLSQDRELFSVEDTTPVAAGGAMADEIAQLRNINDDWYGLTGDWFGAIEIKAVAAAIESLEKIHTCSSPDDEIYDIAVTDDVGSALQTLSLTRTKIERHRTPDTGMAAAQLGKNLPKDPGSSIWSFKVLAGIEIEKYTETEQVAMDAKNVGYYVDLLGSGSTLNGKMSSGEFVDIIRFADSLGSDMSTRIISKLKNLDKIAYTNRGISVVETEVRGALKAGVSAGGLTNDTPFVVTVPNAIIGSVGGVSSTDKGNRLLPNVKFTATLAGAIQAIEVTGDITL